LLPFDPIEKVAWLQCVVLAQGLCIVLKQQEFLSRIVQCSESQASTHLWVDLGFITQLMCSALGFAKGIGFSSGFIYRVSIVASIHAVSESGHSNWEVKVRMWAPWKGTNPSPTETSLPDASLPHHCRGQECRHHCKGQ